MLVRTITIIISIFHRAQHGRGIRREEREYDPFDPRHPVYSVGESALGSQLNHCRLPADTTSHLPLARSACADKRHRLCLACAVATAHDLPTSPVSFLRAYAKDYCILFVVQHYMILTYDK